jgi:hypothetical protein
MYTSAASVLKYLFLMKMQMYSKGLLGRIWATNGKTGLTEEWRVLNAMTTGGFK